MRISGRSFLVAILLLSDLEPAQRLSSRMALFAYMMACLLAIRLFDTFFELPILGARARAVASRTTTGAPLSAFDPGACAACSAGSG